MQMKQRNTSDRDSTVESSVDRCACAVEEEEAPPDMPGNDTEISNFEHCTLVAISARKV